jgi:hypothetical protein
MNNNPEFMNTWAIEKASNVVKFLSKARDILSNHDLSKEELEHAESCVSFAIWDASKILSYVTGKEWSVSDVRDIQEHGYEGYERVAAKYGIIYRTEEQQRVSLIEGFTDALSKLLVGDRANRTLVHELLNNTSLKHPIVEKTAKVVELVTQGQLDWKDFCRIMDAEIEELNLPKQKAA